MSRPAPRKSRYSRRVAGITETPTAEPKKKAAKKTTAKKKEES